MRVELATAMGGEEAEEEKKAQIFDSLLFWRYTLHQSSYLACELPSPTLLLCQDSASSGWFQPKSKFERVWDSNNCLFRTRVP